MILSSDITVGQLTFIFRVAIQILGYGGLALIGLLIIGNAPRVAPIDTHDVINRTVGQSTAALTTVKWIFNRVRKKHTDPAPQTSLLFILLLFVSYSAFLALSDIGFLGLYACTVPGPSFQDHPGSISSFEAANKSTLANLVNGTDPTTIALYRCDSAEIQHHGDVTVSQCESWQNSTFADTTLFSGLNSTDSDVLMPRRLAYHVNEDNPLPLINATSLGDDPKLNSFYAGPGPQRVTSPTIQNGVFIQPHGTGSRTIIGIPQLDPEHNVHLDKTLAFELEVGCHSLGIFSQHNTDLTRSAGVDFISLEDWERYSGPDYMKDTLHQAALEIRDYWRPFFTVDEGDGIIYSNFSTAPFSLAATVKPYQLPGPEGNRSMVELTPTKAIIGNCTASLLKTLHIDPSATDPGTGCGLLGIGGPVETAGKLATGFSRMICGASMQVNMVTADIALNKDRELSLDYTRLPSDLHVTRADIWSRYQVKNDTAWITYDPYVRFTLGDNSQGSTNHYIPPIEYNVTPKTVGVGTCGLLVEGMSHALLDAQSEIFGIGEYSALGFLDRGFDATSLAPNVTTRWLGEVGASFFVNSLAYKGFSAIDTPPILVRSTGGQAATCYKPAYAFGFLPLVLAALVVLCWTLVMVVSAGISGYGALKDSYGGTEPFVSSVYPGAPPTRTLAAWNKGQQPYLQLVGKGETMTGEPRSTALKYFKSDLSY